MWNVNDWNMIGRTATLILITCSNSEKSSTKIMVPFSEGKLQGFQVAPPQVLLSLGSDSGPGFGVLHPNDLLC
jgi:hypothetical protein